MDIALLTKPHSWRNSNNLDNFEEEESKLDMPFYLPKPD